MLTAGAEEIDKLLGLTVGAAAEVTGAMGLILPGLLRIRPLLAPLAACGLLIITNLPPLDVQREQQRMKKTLEPLHQRRLVQLT